MADFPIKKDVNINGAVNSYVYPQHEKADGSFVVTGEKNPLPVADYGMTSGGLWIPKRVSDDGAAHTQVTGSSVEFFKKSASLTSGAGNIHLGKDVASSTMVISVPMSKDAKKALVINNKGNESISVGEINYFIEGGIAARDNVRVNRDRTSHDIPAGAIKYIDIDHGYVFGGMSFRIDYNNGFDVDAYFLGGIEID